VKTNINLVMVHPHLTHSALPMNGCFCNPMNCWLRLLLYYWLLGLFTTNHYFFWYGFFCCLISIHCEQGSSIFVFEKIISSFDVCDFVTFHSAGKSRHDDHINQILIKSQYSNGYFHDTLIMRFLPFSSL
jgi:hypothetical protein